MGVVYFTLKGGREGRKERRGRERERMEGEEEKKGMEGE